MTAFGDGNTIKIFPGQKAVLTGDSACSATVTISKAGVTLKSISLGASRTISVGCPQSERDVSVDIVTGSVSYSISEAADAADVSTDGLAAETGLTQAQVSLFLRKGVHYEVAYASFPAASSVPAGTVALASDTGAKYVSNGVNWISVRGSIGGVYSGPLTTILFGDSIMNNCAPGYTQQAILSQDIRSFPHLANCLGGDHSEFARDL